MSFALLEDRKFKSSRYVKDPDPSLLGKRQLDFLAHWATDWRNATLKVVLSQTIYASAHTDRQGRITRDRDTNGWPKPGRDRAVKAFRKARALVLCGDQHLSTLMRLGLEDFNDGPVQFCVPALGNIFWRWFYPRTSGTGPLADPQGYTGDFEDPFGNRFRMLAAANPTDVKFMGDRNQTLRRWNSRPGTNVDSVRLCQGDGFGILRLDTGARTYRIECWPYDVEPVPGGSGQFKGWPAVFSQEQMDGRKAEYYIARVDFPPGTRVCAAVYETSKEDLVYSVPLEKPGQVVGVYEPGSYRLVLYDPDRDGVEKSYPDLPAEKNPEKAPLLKFGR